MSEAGAPSYDRGMSMLGFLISWLALSCFLCLLLRLPYTLCAVVVSARDGIGIQELSSRDLLLFLFQLSTVVPTTTTTTTTTTARRVAITSITQGTY